MHGGIGLKSSKFESCLESIRPYLSGQKDVKSAVLYGSVARGQARADSDLDILIIAPRNFHEELAHDLFRIGAKYDVNVSPYIIDQTELDLTDPQFLETVVRDGVVLKGEPINPTLRQIKLEPFRVVSYRLEGLSQSDKVSLSRELYGYQSSRAYKGRIYRSYTKGFIEKAGGWKLGRGSLLVPEKAWAKLEKTFDKRKAKRWSFTVWVQSQYS